MSNWGSGFFSYFSKDFNTLLNHCFRMLASEASPNVCMGEENYNRVTTHSDSGTKLQQAAIKNSMTFKGKKTTVREAGCCCVGLEVL